MSLTIEVPERPEDPGLFVGKSTCRSVGSMFISGEGAF